jgi:hypothetical protein
VTASLTAMAMDLHYISSVVTSLSAFAKSPTVFDDRRYLAMQIHDLHAFVSHIAKAVEGRCRGWEMRLAMVGMHVLQHHGEQVVFALGMPDLFLDVVIVLCGDYYE